MKEKTLRQEKEYLNRVSSNLNDMLQSQKQTVEILLNQSKELQRYYVRERNEIDDAEAANIETQLRTARSSIEHSQARQARLEKIRKSPYFGRIDFTPDDKEKSSAIYIGIGDFEADGKHLIHDWRAPVSSMFYDFKLGKASYKAPIGYKKGILSLKRQFKIHYNKVEYMFDTSLNIGDEVLRQELGASSSTHMRNIVNTIQAEQNKIIRNENGATLIIQGHAGSGKTSIALHRIAYLLYRQRTHLKSSEILIISPNKVFSDYISDVLPELGEQTLARLSIEDVAKQFLDPRLRFSKSDLDTCSPTEAQAYLSSFDIISDLEKYATHLKARQFEPRTIKCKDITLEANEILSFSRRAGGVSLQERKKRLSEFIVDEFEFRTRLRVNKHEKEQIRDAVNSMYTNFNGVEDFTNFFNFIGHPEYAPTSIKVLPFSYVFPFIYLRIRLSLIETIKDIKHIIIDEMQDYTPIQFKTLQTFFNTQMTILGDINQSIHGCISTNINDIEKSLPGSEIVYLNKSYRSTFEIMNLARHVLHSDNLEIIERHGVVPTILKYLDDNKLIQMIIERAHTELKNNTKTIGIILKTEKEALDFYSKVYSSLSNAHLITPESTFFEEGVSIVSTAMAKGIEFDYVIIPNADASNYHTELDRRHLYVGITRAKHSLDIFYKNELTPFLIDAPAILE